jgi:hypothetical protein
MRNPESSGKKRAHDEDGKLTLTDTRAKFSGLPIRDGKGSP